MWQEISNINLNTKRFSEFVNAYKKAYSHLKKAVQLERVQKLWNDVKNGSTKFEETLVDLQKKMQRKKSKKLSLWSSLKSKANQRISLKIWLKHRNHPVRVGINLLLSHLFKIGAISFKYRVTWIGNLDRISWFLLYYVKLYNTIRVNSFTTILFCNLKSWGLHSTFLQAYRYN